MTTVIDIRAPSECPATPSSPPDGVGYQNLPVLDDAALVRLNERYDMEGDNYPWVLKHRPHGVGTILTAIADAPPGGVLVHCGVGKDRTGLIEEADIVGFDSGSGDRDPASWTLTALAAKARLVREAAGHDLELHLNPDAWEITANRRQAIEAVARAAGVDADGLARSAYVLVGSVEYVVEHLQAVREAAGISYVTIPSDRMDEFAPVVTALRSR